MTAERSTAAAAQPGRPGGEPAASSDFGPRDGGSARHLAQSALTQLGRTPDRRGHRALLRHLTAGRFGREQPGWPLERELATPWQDTASGERRTWRCRAAYLSKDEHGPRTDDVEVLDGQPRSEKSFKSRPELVFSVDYQVCRRCRLGWVEYPWTAPRYRRCGLAAAGLAAVRQDHRSAAWHTLGGHSPDSRAFWATIGSDVPGGYVQRRLCPHVTAG